MGSITTAMPVSLKAEMAQAIHNFAASGDDFKCALIVGSPTGTYDQTTTNYSSITGNSDEVSGTGYTAGGFDFTAANNITPLTSGGTAYWQFNANPSWSGATFSTGGCIIYNSSKSNRSGYIGSFGGTQTVTAGTFTLVMPANGPTTSLLRIQ